MEPRLDPYIANKDGTSSKENKLEVLVWLVMTPLNTIRGNECNQIIKVRLNTTLFIYVMLKG